MKKLLRVRIFKIKKNVYRETDIQEIHILGEEKKKDNNNSIIFCCC